MSDRKASRLVDDIQRALFISDDLRKRKWRDNPNLFAGHCYVASEALYHLLGGKASGLTPMTVRANDSIHWFLRTKEGQILDPTVNQFGKLPKYSDARGRGFLTAQPSKRAQLLIQRVRRLSGKH